MCATAADIPPDLFDNILLLAMEHEALDITQPHAAGGVFKGLKLWSAERLEVSRLKAQKHLKRQADFIREWKRRDQVILWEKATEDKSRVLRGLKEWGKTRRAARINVVQ